MERAIVIGAGPCGSLAAAEAARRGARVSVFEEHSKIGSPVKCAGLVSITGLSELGIRCKKAVMNKIYGAKLFSNGSEITIRAREPKAVVLDRAVFDAACAEMAEKQGARIITGKKAKADGAKVIIAADGFPSGIAKSKGFPEIRDYIFCYQEEMEGVLCESDMAHMFISKKLFPGFFGWVVPTGDSCARVGCGVKHGNPKLAFEKFIKNKIFGRARRGEGIADCIPLSVREKTVKGNILLVGDAAGHVKSTTGGGIVFGGLCAKIAGAVAERALNGGSTHAYEAEWRKLYGKELALHRGIRNALDNISDRHMGVYFRIAKKLGIEKFLLKHGDMDRPSLFLGKAASFYNPLFWHAL